MQMLRFCSLMGFIALLISCHPQSSSLNTAYLKKSFGIIGGTAASENEFPFVVNIWFNSAKDNYVAHLCGVSFIKKCGVLTAAHCVLEDDTESTMRVVAVTKLELFVGSNAHSGAGGRKLRAKSISVHPEFSWPKHDVALIELADAVTDILPIALNDTNLGDSDGSASVIGWGLMDAAGKTESENLQKVNLSLVPRKLCAQDEFPRSKDFEVSAETLCAQTFSHQTSSCPGDSGGPLFQVVAGKPVQIGIVSWGSACSGNRSKINSSVAGYADVSDALAWIQKTIK
jgi:secreted trypsin-like serine protease